MQATVANIGPPHTAGGWQSLPFYQGNLVSNPNPNPIYCPLRVAMFGVQRGEGVVQFDSARSGTQGGPLTHPHCGTSFSLSHVCLYLHAKLVQSAAQKLLTFVWHLAAFFTQVCA